MKKTEQSTPLAQRKLLIADDSLPMQAAVQQSLSGAYDILIATTGSQILELAAKNPDIIAIVMDLMMPHLNSLQTIQALKADFLTCNIPIIILASQEHQKQMLLAVEMGADDYIKKPFDPIELNARLIMNLRRAERDQNSNPLTKLPGNPMINRTILQRIHMPVAILYADLDNFKAYNDKYGFNKGDDVLIHTAQVLSWAVKHYGNHNDFLGNIGGDDFVIISTPEKSEAIAQAICTRFDQDAPQFYDEEDKKLKKIISHDRVGNVQEFPLVSISIAIVNNEKKELTSMPQIAQIASELKHFAKSKPMGIGASNYVKDRRS